MTMPFRPRNTPPLTLRGSIFSRSSRKAELREEVAEPRRPGARHGRAQIFGDLPRRAFRRLQRDIAGEALGDDDVDRAPAEIVAFHEAAILEARVVHLAQDPAGLAHLLHALDLLHPDIEERRPSAGRGRRRSAPWPRP